MDPKQPIYLDYNATTPIRPEVLAEMLPFFAVEFGNPSSAHAYGYAAAPALALARKRLAALLGCQPFEIVFTGCGSEADNLALKGVADALRHRGNHIITSSIEHPAVLESCHWLEGHGCEVTYLPVDGTGCVDPADVKAALTERTVLVSVMHANNETGILQPIREIAAITRARGVPLHSDAAQTVGKVPVNVDAMGVDLLAVAGHKFYAPKGVGALYVRSGTSLEPLIHGGGQESGRRAGTENVALIAGLGKAAELAGADLASESARLAALRDRLWERLQAAPGSVRRNGSAPERVPNTLNVSFEGVFGADVLAAVPGIAASTSSACHTVCSGPPSVLLAMGLSHERAAGAVRFSLGRHTTEADVEEAAALLARAVKDLRARSQRL